MKYRKLIAIIIFLLVLFAGAYLLACYMAEDGM